ncbi:acyl carrier protein [Nocardiopsis alkaliphila]|uniref:acyl carrier protein n=1 Tax=Nocardiopsis alkaliphila TaxID=225762 RepID=UPI0003462325|nr:acyl carrier protein [Nocardiopsis alkaliphila]
MASGSAFEGEVKKIYVELFELDTDPGSITTDEELFGPQCDYGIDSMDVLRFLAELRSRYDLDVSEIATETFRTAGSIANFLSEREAGSTTADSR